MINQFAWTHLEGERAVSDRALKTGDVVYSFRGEAWSFVRVSREAAGNSTGRVQVERFCPDGHAVGNGWECDHSWHRGGIETGEYYPSVFGLYLGDAEGEQA